MFEQWSERRRRWFLITFCATGWTLFANSLAMLGRDFVGGGIGPDAFHSAAIVATIALWTVLSGALRLRLRHWLWAVLFGISLNAALVEFGLRDHAAAGIWAIACDAGEGAACQDLADYFADGRSPIHGELDARPLDDRARRLASTAPQPDVQTAEPAAAPTYAQQRLQCARADDFGSAASCFELLDSGFHPYRLEACGVLDDVCSRSSEHYCAVTLIRCARARSPHAGVD